jgi:shikimate 5-dehydrogenase
MGLIEHCLQISEEKLMWLDVSTILYDIMAKPVFHSLSPLIKNAVFQAYSLRFMLPFEVTDVARAPDGFRTIGGRFF